MQDNHSQWHVEQSSLRKVNSVTKENNEGLTAMVGELICMINDNESQGNAITDAKVEEVDCMAHNNPYPTWMNKIYSSNFQKPYPNPA
jgi:alanine-alpha-ketoisovalerate/valine-pyruvate aminotransferase